MEVCVLASGSSGNATLVRSGSTAILIDCGISYRELVRRMDLSGGSASEITAILVTHDHSDHVGGVPVSSRRLGIPVYSSRQTCRKTSSGHGGSVPMLFDTDLAFEVGDLDVTPFPVPHDALEPVGFVVSDERTRLGIATDLGSVTLEVLAGLSGCEAVIIESNHDREMLLDGPYPPYLKRRVDGPDGHLSNDDAATIVESILHPGLRHVVLAHLSRTNNRPELSIRSTERALGRSKGRIRVSVGMQDRPCPVIRL